MKMKKLLAIILCIGLCAALFASCTETNKQNTPAGNDTENTQNESSDFVPSLSNYDWKYSDDELMLTVGENNVTFEDYRFFAMSNKYYFDYGDESYWTDTTNDEYKKIISDQLQQLCALKSLCNDKLGIFFDEEDAALMEEKINNLKLYYPEGQFEEALDYSFFTEEHYRKLGEYDYLTEKLYRSFVTDEEIKKYANENYVRVQHVLISTLDDTGAELPEEELAKKKALADEIYNKAIGGEDFYSLVEQYGEDPGMENNPEGYSFTYGYMVEEFEEASFALEVGGISKPVKTSYGYHIIKKLPLNEEYFLDRRNGEYLDIIYALGGEEGGKAILEHLETLEVVETDKFKEVNMQNIGTPKK